MKQWGLGLGGGFQPPITRARWNFIHL